MNRFVLRSLLAAAATACAAGPVLAGPQQGVTCPSGFDALIPDGNRKLVCRKVVRFERDAVCLPTHQLTDRGTAVDQCVVKVPNTNVQHTMPPTAMPIVTLPGQQVVEPLKQVPTPNAPDKFVAVVHEFAFPKGNPYPYVGDASKGVGCPSGYDGDKVSDGRGIRCDKLDGAPKSADCDGIVGWEWKQDLAGAEDRCRNIVTGATGPTKPTGMTKIQHDAERASDDVGWVLNKRSGARDTWQRKVYAFPIQ